MFSKLLFCIFLFFSFSFQVISQKYDHTWILGSEYLDDNEEKPEYKNKITFDGKTLKIDKITALGSIVSGYNVSASDSLGNLIFYFNGLKVFNRNHQVMTNGDSIGYDLYSWLWEPLNKYCGCVPAPDIDPLPYTSKFIPFPGHKDQYIIFSPLVPPFPEGSLYNVLSYIRIDMSLSNGLGAVIEKNNIILDSRIDGFGLVKHANSNDWWLVAPILGNNIFYIYLISKDGVTGPKKIINGPEPIPYLDPTNYYLSISQGSSQNCDFSPDGRFFFRNESGDYGLFIYDFDRCNGNIKFKRQITGIPFTYEFAFSPDSRFLYFITNRYDVNQLDLHNQNDEYQKTFIGRLPYPSAIETGSNGKIYFAHDYVNYLSYINRPELPGIACDLKIMSIKLSQKIAFTTPQYPNYRLKAMNNMNYENQDTIFLPHGEPKHYTFEGKNYIFANRSKYFTDNSWNQVLK